MNENAQAAQGAKLNDRANEGNRCDGLDAQATIYIIHDPAH